MNLKIDIYTTIYNEEPILPYYLRHYGAFAQRIYVFIDKCTDKSREILKQHPKVTIFDVEESGINEGYWTSKLWTKYEELSRGKADYVALVDADEFLYHPNLIGVLKKERKMETQLIQPEGFYMISETFPTTAGQIYEEIKNGVPDFWATQSCLFDPSIYIRFRWGCHSIARIGRHVLGKTGREIGIKILHYRYLGKDYCDNRTIKNFSRFYIGAIPPPFDVNKKHQLPDRTRGRFYDWFKENKSKAVNVVD